MGLNSGRSACAPARAAQQALAAQQGAHALHPAAPGELGDDHRDQRDHGRQRRRRNRRDSAWSLRCAARRSSCRAPAPAARRSLAGLDVYRAPRGAAVPCAVWHGRCRGASRGDRDAQRISGGKVTVAIGVVPPGQAEADGVEPLVLDQPVEEAGDVAGVELARRSAPQRLLDGRRRSGSSGCRGRGRTSAASACRPAAPNAHAKAASASSSGITNLRDSRIAERGPRGSDSDAGHRRPPAGSRAQCNGISTAATIERSTTARVHRGIHDVRVGACPSDPGIADGPCLFGQGSRCDRRFNRALPRQSRLSRRDTNWMTTRRRRQPSPSVRGEWPALHCPGCVQPRGQRRPRSLRAVRRKDSGPTTAAPPARG